jgi:kinetochore protein Spc7/SPC105
MVAFDDPRAIAEELDREQQDEGKTEGRGRTKEKDSERLQGEDATLNLMEMINSLTPKKNALKSRKSLHVGSAKGLLGKRPAELDDEDDTEERDGVKRLKGHEGSPVKNVKLQAPPSKAETTGRMAGPNRRGLEQIDRASLDLSTGRSSDMASTPRSQGRLTDRDDDRPATTVGFDKVSPGKGPELQPDHDEQRIHLQDFLNMTSIRFMELTTTKRRHTVAPPSLTDSSSIDTKEDLSIERCVVAGACTVPMLELYQHVS